MQKTGALGIWEADLRYEAQKMGSLPHTVVYLEAGYSDANPPGYTARVLNAAGVRQIRGFFTNDTHINWTINEIRWAAEGLEDDRRRELHRQHRAERPRADCARATAVENGNEDPLQPAGPRARAAADDRPPAFAHDDAFLWTGPRATAAVTATAARPPGPSGRRGRSSSPPTPRTSSAPDTQPNPY